MYKGRESHSHLLGSPFILCVNAEWSKMEGDRPIEKDTKGAIWVFYCAITTQTKWLQATHTYYLVISVDQKSIMTWMASLLRWRLNQGVGPILLLLSGGSIGKRVSRLIPQLAEFSSHSSRAEVPFPSSCQWGLLSVLRGHLCSLLCCTIIFMSAMVLQILLMLQISDLFSQTQKCHVIR